MVTKLDMAEGPLLGRLDAVCGRGALSHDCVDWGLVKLGKRVVDSTSSGEGGTPNLSPRGVDNKERRLVVLSFAGQAKVWFGTAETVSICRQGAHRRRLGAGWLSMPHVRVCGWWMGHTSAPGGLGAKRTTYINIWAMRFVKPQVSCRGWRREDGMRGEGQQLAQRSVMEGTVFSTASQANKCSGVASAPPCRQSH